MRMSFGCGLLSVLILAGNAAFSAPLFRITDVGQANSPAAINEKSQVLIDGTFADSHDVVWTGGNTKDVSTYPNQVFDFNDKGRVVGYILDPVKTVTTPVYWPKAGKEPRTLDQSFPDGSAYDRATGINTAGQIVGWLYFSDFQSGPAYWDKNGVLTDLRPFVEPHGYLFPNYPKINDKGVIAVTSGDHGYRIDAASLNTVRLQGFDTKDAFGCNDCSQALGINDKNSIVGSSRVLFHRQDGSSGVRDEATIWNNRSKAKDVGILHIGNYPDANSYANAINSSDWVVGNTISGNVGRPFLWTPDDKIKDLNKLIDPSDPKHGLVTLLTATAINNKGQIAGVLSDSTQGGAQRIYMLTPVQ